MLTLVYKDLICQKRSLWLIFAYAVFMHVGFLSAPGNSAYAAAAVAVTYAYVMGQCALEDKNRTDVLINSLPVLRDTVVKAKYVTACIFMLVGVLASIVVGTVIRHVWLDRSLVDLQTIVVMVVASVFLWSVFYPVYFKFGYIKARYYNLFVFLLILYTSSFLNERFNDAWREGAVGLPASANQHDFIPVVLLLAVTLLLSLFSLAISLKIYRAREFF